MHTRSPRQESGFTLVELVVAMLIASVLAAIAIPSYSNYVRKARRTDVKTALLDLASLEERYFTNNNVYTGDSASLGYAAGNNWPIAIGSYYQMSQPDVSVTAVAPTATTSGTPARFTLSAVAIVDQLKDTQCRTFTVASDGTQTATDASGNVNTQTCWH
jgi:type IV pilus assembly protein PilE